MKQQIKVIVSETRSAKLHAKEVNDFLNKSIEIVSIQNEVLAGNSFSKYTRPEIVTVITYKGELC